MKTKFIVFFSGAIVILFGIAVLFKMKEAPVSITATPPDLTTHPVYSKYKFREADNTIDIGVQPLYSSTGHISETIRRDAILREALTRLGLEVRFYAFLKGGDVNYFLHNGKLDAGFGGDMPALTAAASMEVIIPASIYSGYTSIVANRPMIISELREKRIAYAFGSNAHYALLNALSAHGLTEAHVNLVPMDVTQMPEALHKQKITAFSAWEPIPTLALAKYPESVVIHRHLSTGYLYFTVIFRKADLCVGSLIFLSPWARYLCALIGKKYANVLTAPP